MHSSEKEYPEGNDRVISKGPCPKCGSQDNLRTYADGHTHCYSMGCGHRTPPTGEVQTTSHSSRSSSFSVTDSNLLEPDAGSWPKEGLKSRRITVETMRRFGVFTPGFKGKRVQAYPYFNQDGSQAGQKIRLPDKDFPFIKADGGKSLGEAQLFGRHVFGDRFDRQVIICEGELDALSVAQEMNFKTAVVSVNAGAGNAAKNLKANYLWLDRFEDIVIWFDDDQPGRDAAEECAKLFKVGKVRIAKHGEFKDASDVLQAERPGDIQTTIYAATKWRPKGIVNAADNEDDVTTANDEEHSFKFTWPWPELDTMFGPILPGQVVYNVAGTGVGKTTFTNHTVLSLMGQGAKIAFFSFEGTRKEVKIGILGVASGKRLDIEPLPDEDMRALHKLYFGGRNLELFDPETAEWSTEAIENYARYCAKALDCQVIFIDPLSFVVAGMAATDNVVQALDTVSRNFAAMAKELGVHLQISHHLSRPQGTAHEEGAQTSINQVRGSGSIANFASIVIGHERNQQADGDDKLLTQLRSLKNRPRSRTGPVMVLTYDLSTGQLTPSNKPFPQPGAGKGDTPPFSSVSGDDY